MPKSSFIDFKALKSAITMEQLLQHYGLVDQFKRSRDSLSGPCPIHKGSNPTQFRVSVSKNIWNCFSECKSGGNVLDFIAKMENVSIYAAALKAIEWLGLDPAAISAHSDQGFERKTETTKPDTASAPKLAPKKEAMAAENNSPNKPLAFRLDKLERNHPYLAERGLTPETIVDFGLGYCTKGMMQRGLPFRYITRTARLSPMPAASRVSLPKICRGISCHRASESPWSSSTSTEP